MTENYIAGVIFALATPISFALTNSSLSRPLIKSDPVLVNFVVMVLGLGLTLAATTILGQAGPVATISPFLLFLLAVTGLFHFNIGRFLNFTAVKQVGANQAAPLISTQIVYSVVFAVLFLGESVTAAVVAGAALIGIGVSILNAGESARLRKGRSRIGVAAGLTTGLIWGLTPILISYTLKIYPFFLAATFVAYCFGFVTYIPFLWRQKVKQSFAGVSAKTLVTYCFAGAALAIAQMTRFAALQFAPVVIVVPILATAPVFTVVLTWRIAKDVEVFRRRTIISILMCVIGTVLVSDPQLGTLGLR